MLSFEEANLKYKDTEFVNLFKELVNLLSPNTYVELGVRRGYTFNQISPLVNRAVAVDINIRDSIISLPNVEKYQMTTDEFSTKWTDPINFLFIDACHEKEQVLKDFKNMSKFVVVGSGIIAMHDTYPRYIELLQPDRCWNAREAFWEIRSTMRDSFEAFTIPGPFAGLSLLRKIKMVV